VLAAILQKHRERPFDYVVHLGDTYFGGGSSEVLENFLVPFNCFRKEQVPAKVVSLCGNHDLYYGPAGYLAALEMFQQPARFFLVQTPHWRLAFLDTSLAAYSFRNHGKLDKTQLDWLKGILREEDPRPLVLLSHHYLVSAWGSTSPQLEAQLRDDIRGKVFAWYWGHEHRMVAYERDPWTFYGACVGNGVFPEAYSEPKHSRYKIAWYPKSRCRCEGRSDNWPHGYLEVELRPKGQLWECYHMEGEQPWERTLVVEQPAKRPAAVGAGGRAGREVGQP
jgi:3',5'-cyclic AMP phosphodiesterase CpdA